MKPIKKILTLAVIGAAGVATFQVGQSLVQDVRFARAEEKVEHARSELRTLGDLSNSYKTISKSMEQSVVHLRVTKTGRGMRQLPQFDDETLRRFFDRDGDGEPDVPEDGVAQASGSGVIMDAGNGEAFIVTNNHVIADASTVEIVLEDGRHITDAKVVGADPKSDLAVVKIQTDRVIKAKWGDSDKLEKGDIILAFGSPFGYVGSMSHGIVSALNRQANVISNSFAYENFIQVDAPINPGNSGGPLVNLAGEVVGINTAIASRSGSFSGIGFAIPSNQAKQVYEALKTSGKIVRGYLGVQIADIKSPPPPLRERIDAIGYEGEDGIFVDGVLRSSPAYNVLKPGDVITEIDGQPVKSTVALRNKIAATGPGQDVKLTIFRNKKTQSVTVKLGEQPDEQSEMAMRNPADLPGNSGIGVTLVTPTADDLEAAGLPADARGALVKQVRPSSLAARAGVRPGDLITRVGDTDIANVEDARKALAAMDLSKGTAIQVANREGERMVTIKQGPNPTRQR
ncbi:MAG: trypsin-like peptidase domain-containing protein [Burkholderiales bacterium]|nr:trypsin-like peptidase domain-containing protein [Phycisphaerae bacterium]